MAGRFIFYKLVILLALFCPLARAQDNLFQLQRRLERESSQEGPGQGEALAKLVALERLTGQLDKAKDHVAACKAACLRQVPKDEQKSWRLWLCSPTSVKKELFAVCKQSK